MQTKSELTPSVKRSVRTLLILAQEKSLEITSVKAHKLMYFAHGLCLAKHGTPIGEGIQFDAWRYGPLFEPLYHYFKFFGSSVLTPDLFPIKNWGQLDVSDQADEYRFNCLSSILNQFGHLPASALINLSRDKEGPWAQIMNGPKDQITLDDAKIQAYFQDHLCTADEK